MLNKSNGQNKTKDQVTEAMNQVNSAKNNLDGTRLLDQAKQTAKQQLNNMTHLTTARKTNLTNQINSGTTVVGVHTVQSNANTLDQAMNTLDKVLLTMMRLKRVKITFMLIMISKQHITTRITSLKRLLMRIIIQK